MNITPQQIIEALRHVRYPGSKEDIVSSGMLQDDICINGRKVTFSIRFTKTKDPFMASLIKAAETAILTYVSEDIEIKGNVQAIYDAPPVRVENFLEGVKNTIAVFSGKGGVGKSTITANLAVALSLRGHSVGILDADIHGPSMPKMFGVEEEHPGVVVIEGKGEAIEPIEVYNGIKLLSIGFFVDRDKALIWRGSMASNAVSQLLNQGNWGELDYLLIDMPPGTSDIHLTLVQTIGLTGIVIVTTPQEVALIDARKGIDMFTNDKVAVPILGLVENMSWFTPEELPDNRYYIFGRNGGVKLAKEMEIPLLAQLPIVQSVCQSGDTGLPVAAHAGTILSNYFDNFAACVEEEVARRNRETPPSRKVEVSN